MGQTIGEAYIDILPSAAHFGDELGKSLGGAVAGAAGAVTAATAAVTAFAGASVKAGSEFDSSMSQVAATMGLVIDEQGRYMKDGEDMTGVFADLRDFAQEMGSTTAFSATQASDALNYMALAGYDATTSMTVLPSVLDLAAAGGIGLADASDMVTDALSALGKGSDYAEILVDQMAKTAASSNTSVEQLGEAILTLGATGKSAAGGTQELSTMLGVLANNGIKGSEAGTHLRNLMLAMNPVTDKAVEAWDALGVSGYDAQGNLRPLQDTFMDLKDAMAGMSDQEKTDILTKMFNKTDLASVNAILGQTSETFEELSAAIGDSTGAAAGMAGTQLENLAGDVTFFKSAFEGMQIAISDMLTPALREVVQFATDGVDEVASALRQGDIEGAFTNLGDYLAAFINNMADKAPQFVEAGIGLISALLTGLLSNSERIIESAVEIVGTVGRGIFDNLPMLIQTGIDIILQLADALVTGLPEMIPYIVDIMLQIIDTLIANVDKLAVAAVEIILTLGYEIIKALPRLVAKIPEVIMAIVGALKAGLDKIKEIGPEMVEGLWNGINSKVDWLKEKIKSFASSALNAIKDFFGIHSPSRVFADEVGAMLPQGMAVGIDANTSAVTEAMQDMADEAVGVGANIEGQLAGSAYSAQTLSGDNSGLYALLAEYLPYLADKDNVQVNLEGDAAGLFRMIKNQNSQYKKSTGVSAFV